MPAEAGGLPLVGAVVVDASVAVEYLVALSLTAQAEAVFHAALDEDTELWAPDLLYPEAVSAVRRLLRLRLISRPAAATAVEDLARLPLEVAGTRGLMSRAWRLRDAMTPYDACYVVLAEALGGPLVTADRRLARTLTRTGARVVFLGDLR
jgi:predicted nucleic acid-binding protein